MRARGLAAAGLPEAAVQVIATTDRAAVGSVADEHHVDVIVPRGGKGLIERVAREATVRSSSTLDGVCHVFVDEHADVDMAVRIADNAKTQRYSPCNTMETLLVHAASPRACSRCCAPTYAGQGRRAARRPGRAALVSVR